MMFPTFDEFFAELNEGCSPFPWQCELARRAVIGEWPDFISAPTGSGKTACLEVAVYALAAQAHLSPGERTASRRIFFIVNRRVIVDEAFERARRMALALADPGVDRPACAAVATALRALNPAPFPRPPLDCVQLRGAIFRDQRWARSLLQPTIVATTIDQIGSRLLFRGYGVTQNARPIHAALVATDALWILDEAHISRPFAETVAALQRFREHHLAHTPGAVRPPPMRWVQMTATPPEHASHVIGLAAKDREHPVLAQRLNAAKPARLTISVAKSKAKAQETLAAHLVDHAATIIAETSPRSLAILVNRVATARMVHDLVEKETRSRKARFRANTTLLIGRMRPVDRDAETRSIQEALKDGTRRSANPDDEAAPPVTLVVATQCLEVGADLDFDAMVTECASLDALRQRFGRLNRAGRDIKASATIVMQDLLIEGDQRKLDKLTSENQLLDPIYGNALSATWNWLQSVASEDRVDFGLAPMARLLEGVSDGELGRLQAPTSSAPTIFPAYLDAWAQTHPAPWPDPEPAIFLHGKQPARPDVLVVWRADLAEDAGLESAVHDLSLCPPTQVEALPVPIQVFENWFFQAGAKAGPAADIGDLLDSATSADPPAGRKELKEPLGSALLWRGANDSRWVDQPEDIFPGATIVLPVTLGGWGQLGHVPLAPADPSEIKSNGDQSAVANLVSMDRATDGFRITRDRALLRLRAGLFRFEGGGETWRALLDYAGDAEQSLRPAELRNLMEQASRDQEVPQPLRETLALLADRKLGFVEARYADETGIVFTTRRRLGRNQVITQAEDEGDEWSRAATSGPVTLRLHTTHVVDLVAASADALGLNQDIRDCLAAAAKLHDWGKLDPRFQALLLGGNPHAAYALPEPLAKSDRLHAGKRERELAHQRSGLPKGFRHEFASLDLAAHSDAASLLPAGPAARDLVSHLIASHHGYARPFAPVIEDPEPPPLSSRCLPGAQAVEINTAQRVENPAHRLDSGVPDRFWRLLRQHGPWGLAFLETVLRLADQQASEAEAEGWYQDGASNPETSIAS